MLYHVPDRPKALSEIRRVLKDGGRINAATGGRDQFHELIAMVRRFDPGLVLWEGRGPDSFVLETGAEQLAPWFSEVTLHRYDDALSKPAIGCQQAPSDVKVRSTTVSGSEGERK
jgi:SAM-dependent methyltransferase